MKHLLPRTFLALLAAGLVAFVAGVYAQETAPAAEPPVAAESAVAVPESPAEEENAKRSRWREQDSDIISIGHDALLSAGEQAESVISILGSSISAGEVQDAVVSIIGDTRVTGPVGDAAVAVLGDLYIDSKVDGDAVAVLGDVVLGPHAEIGGDLVVIGGSLTRDPAALVHGGVETVLTGKFMSFGWLRPWFKYCLRYGRPLSLTSGLGWAWGLALGFLAFYCLLALLFRDAVDRCVATLEQHPGSCILAAFLAMLLTPLVFALLFVTVIGILGVPVFVVTLFGAALFGKTVMLASLGQRFTRGLGANPQTRTVVAVLIGGALVLALYLVPVLGFIVFNLLGMLGLGAVIYTLLLATKSAASESAAVTPPPIAPAAASTDPDATEASTATAAPPAVTASLPRAGFWIRMIALALDCVLVGVLMHMVHDEGGTTLLILAAYGAVMWKLKGSTIGGIIFGLQVTRLDGRPIDWSTAIVRALSCFLSLVVAGLGFLWIAFDEDKQAWHDKIAGTVVVRAPKGVPLV